MSMAMAQPLGRGFQNLLAHENKAWWGSRRWLGQLLLGVVGLGGFLAFALFVLPGMTAGADEVPDPREMGIQLFFGLSTLVLAIDVIILTQDTIIGEKQSGIAEWVLSKPVSRPAYMMSKLLAHGLGILITLLLLPGFVAYLLFLLAGITIPLANFVPAMAMVGLSTFFYLALSLLMGVVANSRGVLLAVTLGSALGGAVLADFMGRLAFLTPWPLGRVAVAMAQGMDLPGLMWAPAIAAAILTVGAIVASIWLFARAEL